MFLVVPSRWWPGGYGISGETSFNKQILLWCGVIWLLVLSPLSGHGGAERGGTPAKSGCGGGVWGDSIKHELNQADRNTAVAILCRHGGEYSTSSAEALRASRRSSTTPCYQVVHPRWLRDGRRLQLITGREPASIQFLFLGGNASRTPASGGSDPQGPDCLELDCIRVFFVKWKPFSSNVRFLRATDERAFLQNYVPATLLI
jgi:hypothetical protein